MHPTPATPDILRNNQTPPRWPLLLAWMLCLVALLHALLLFSITDPVAHTAIVIRLLQPIAIVGALVVMLVAALREQTRRRRFCWALPAASMLIIAVTSGLTIAERARGSYATPAPNEWLYPLMYGLSLLGAALYFPRHTWRTGNALRIMLDSATVAVAALALLQSLLPAVLHQWPWHDQSLAAMLYPALNTGMLFAVGAVAARLGRRGGPLLPLVLLSLICLLIADSIFVALAWLPGGFRWHLVEAPLYVLQSVLLALAAYRSIQHPPQVSGDDVRAATTAEWWLWALFPRMLVLAALAALLLIRPVGWLLTVVLLLAGGLHELAAARDQQRVLRAFHASQAQAQRAERSMRQLLARVIHDLAAPVHGLQTALRRSEAESAVLPLAAPHVLHLHYLVEQLRAYQHAQFVRTMSLDLAPVALVPLCAAALDAVQDRADAQGVLVSLDLAYAGSVLAEAGALRRILDNLLANALAATPVGGSIVLRAALADDATARIEVQDSGCGIPLEQQHTIFAPFVRLGSSGTGLGLAIVAEFVAALHGTYGVSSEVGRGSTFWIQLRREKPQPSNEFGV